MTAGHAEAAVAARVRQLEERALAAGLASDAELDAVLASLYQHASPLNGARMVARAWTDPQYAALLLADGNAAAAEIGAAPPAGLTYQLKAVANGTGTHNLVVCTLCSCYPVTLLGPSPSWYKSLAYRSRAVREPRAVLTEFGLQLPPDTEITVWDASAERRYLVVPRRPDGTDGLADDDLTALVTRNGLIGTAAV